MSPTDLPDAKPHASGGIVPTGETAHPDEPTAAPADEQTLDEALKETFPASDPIAPASAATQAEREAPPAGTTAPPPPSQAPVPFPTADGMAAAQGRPPKGGGR